MPGSETSEVIFIAVMMVLILIGSFVAVALFIRTYRKEMRERELHKNAKQAEREADK